MRFNLLKKYIPPVFLIFSFLFLAKVLLLDYFPDFTSYYYGAEYAFEGRNPYIPDENFHSAFIYHPVVLIIFFPLTVFPFFLAGKIWVVLSLLLLMLSIYLLFKVHREKPFDSKNLILTGIILLSFFPAKFTLGMGQINILIFFLFVLSVYFYHRKKGTLSGFFLAMSLLFKIFPIFLPIYFLIRKKWKLLIATFMTCLIALILTVLIFGPMTSVYFFENVVLGAASRWDSVYYNQALSGFLAREVADVSTRGLLRIVFVAIVIAISFYSIAKRGSHHVDSDNLRIGVIITISLLLNTLAWQHHFVWLLYPLLSVYTYLKKKKNEARYMILLVVSYLLMAINFPNPDILPSFAASHAFYGALALWGLSVHLLLNKKVN